MADQEQLVLLQQGVAVWNTWRELHPEIWPNLDAVNLSNMNLAGSNFSKTTFQKNVLQHTNLEGANLSEAIFVGADLSGANLKGANLSGAVLTDSILRATDFSEANLSRANLYGAILIYTNMTNAILADSVVWGASVWNVKLEGAKQTGLIITPPYEPTITVDDLEVAQFIYLLLNHKKLLNVLNTVTERGVLILGRFGGGGLEILQAIAAKLREEHYLPIIFDFERPQDRNFTETVKTLAGLSRFVIADLSGPSVPQELYATVPHFKIPLVPIIEAGRKQFAMAVDLLEYPWVIRPPVIFASTEELLSLIPSKILAPAEQKHQARQQLLDELFRRE